MQKKLFMCSCCFLSSLVKERISKMYSLRKFAFSFVYKHGYLIPVVYKYCGMFWLLVDSLQGWICCRGMEREEQIWTAMELEVYPFSYCFLRQHRHLCSWLCKHLHYSSVTCYADVTGAN